MSAIEELTWTLGDRIAKARRYAEMEQAELAEAVGVSRALVSKWERDLSEPSLTQAQRIAQACDVPFEWLSANGYKPTSWQPEVVDHSGQMELAFSTAAQLAAIR